MEHTFMTIHNLTPEANILFASESIIDILGYQPDEVEGKSCFDFFHPDEVPFARSVHSRGVRLDKAAVLHYARVLSQDGRWVSCECCFTVVHDVLVACTSIYHQGEKSERRAKEAPQIRRLFSCSPRDPRYHMLEHLSPKFKMPPVEREPRAALILNRFTRNLNVMFATNAISSILGLAPDQIKDKSFYRCIQENCLPAAIECLESAKANDSIAYLRFWSRDPRDEEDFEEDQMGRDDAEQASNNSTSDSEGGGAELDSHMDLDSDHEAKLEVKEESDFKMDDTLSGPSASASNTNTYATSTSDSDRQTYQSPLTAQSSITAQQDIAAHHHSPPRNRRRDPLPTIELEAVVSCTSDGLVVVLRKARPPIPDAHPPQLPVAFSNGLFAAPWGQQPIQPYFPPDMLYHFQPPLMPQHMPLRENIKAAGGPPLDQLMRSIRDVAVFAWALVGINGNLATYGRGLPRGDAQPPDGLPIWDPNSGTHSYLGPENQAALRWAELGKTRPPAVPGPSFGPSYHPDGYGHPHTQGSAVAPLTQPSLTWLSGAAAPYASAYDYSRPVVQQVHHHQHHHLHLHDGQTPAGSAPSHNPDYAVPTTQAGSPRDSPNPQRYMWQ